VGSSKEGNDVLESLDFLTLSLIWKSKNLDIQVFGNWIYFCPYMREEEPIILGPLERANLSHWTMHEYKP
jgi:hypothetical protein